MSNPIEEVDETLCLFSGLKKKAAYNFCSYWQNHRHRIVNYQHLHTEGICAIASFAVESTVKQIDYAPRDGEAESFRVPYGSPLKNFRCAVES